MKRNMMCMMAAFALLFPVGVEAAHTLDSVSPAQGLVGAEVNMQFTGSGLTDVTHLLVKLGIGEVTTDIAKAAALGTVYGVSGGGSLVYVAGGGKGVSVVNAQDPNSAEVIGTFNTAGYALGVSVVGNLLYVADGGSGLQIIDTTNFAQQLQGSLDTPGYAVGVSVVDGLAYVADFSSLQIIDVSDPAHPYLKGALAMSVPVGRVSVAGGMAYVARGGSTITVIDVSDPTTPRLVQTIDAFGKAYGVAVAGTTLYVADGASGVRAIDVTNPAAPTLKAAKIDTPGKAADVNVVGERLYIADLNSLQIADISGDSLVKAGEKALPSNTFSVQSVDVPGYVSGSGSSLVVPAPLSILPTTQTATTLNFTLPALSIAGPYHLSALDDSNLTVTLPDPVVLSTSIIKQELGWNLLAAQTVVSVDQYFNDPLLFASVWKWVDADTGGKTWAVYLAGGKDGSGTPDNGASYALSKGFLPLDSIAPREGFWVNSLQAAPPLALPGALVPGGLSVVNGWNLVGLKGGQEVPVASLVAGKQASIVSLWKWTDSGTGSKVWAVNLPSGKNGSGTPDSGASYAQSKGFALLTSILPGEGFWVNCSISGASLVLQ